MVDNIVDNAMNATNVTGWLLAGGEGRRMQGQDKGLVAYRDRPLAAWSLDALKAQCATLRISANRNLAQYERLLKDITGEDVDQLVWPDDTDVQGAHGPLAGIITALRHTQTDWLMVVPCDMPHLPQDLVARLLQCAAQTNADIVIPCTQSGTPDERHHWVCGLINKRVCPDTVIQFVNGERKVGNWVRAQHWSSLAFSDASAFTNMNTLETLRGQH